jgi:hypothetical protein
MECDALDGFKVWKREPHSYAVTFASMICNKFCAYATCTSTSSNGHTIHPGQQVHAGLKSTPGDGGGGGGGADSTLEGPAVHA